MITDDAAGSYPSSLLVQNRFPEGTIGEARSGEADMPVVILLALLGLFLVAWGIKLHYVSVIAFKDSCTIDRFFDPLITATFGALIIFTGIYFGERWRR